MITSVPIAASSDSANEQHLCRSTENRFVVAARGRADEFHRKHVRRFTLQNFIYPGPNAIDRQFFDRSTWLYESTARSLTLPPTSENEEKNIGRIGGCRSFHLLSNDAPFVHMKRFIDSPFFCFPIGLMDGGQQGFMGPQGEEVVEATSLAARLGSAIVDIEVCTKLVTCIVSVSCRRSWYKHEYDGVPTTVSLKQDKASSTTTDRRFSCLCTVVLFNVEGCTISAPPYRKNYFASLCYGFSPLRGHSRSSVAKKVTELITSAATCTVLLQYYHCGSLRREVEQKLYHFARTKSGAIATLSLVCNFQPRTYLR